ncbi:MAG: peptidoglycan-binding protein [Symploca sp. SIO2G7]|nr:peptidoglycan-binding protein [Symploca sp. SIO2G7]
METLAYIHLALADEVPTGVGLSEGLDWRKFSSQALIYLLPVIAVIVGILGMVKETLAQQARLGDSGVEVTLIQERLQQLGYFNQPPTGFFGGITESAVREFQIVNRLGVDGIVGQETEAALFWRQRQFPSLDVLPDTIPRQRDFSENRTILQRGDRGDNVRQLQRELLRNGFNPGPIDGIYGLLTERAVRQFQSSKGLPVTGVANQRTLQALRILERDKRRYRVVVPGDYKTLVQVQRYISDARWSDDRRGGYVKVGLFDNRNDAESWSYFLRARGFDARVVYF